MAISVKSISSSDNSKTHSRMSVCPVCVLSFDIRPHQLPLNLSIWLSVICICTQRTQSPVEVLVSIVPTVKLHLQKKKQNKTQGYIHICYTYVCVLINSDQSSEIFYDNDVWKLALNQLVNFASHKRKAYVSYKSPFLILKMQKGNTGCFCDLIWAPILCSSPRDLLLWLCQDYYI